MFGRTGAVVAQAGDYTVAKITGAAALSGATFTGAISAPNLSGTNTGDQNLAPYALLSGATFTGVITAVNNAIINSASTNSTYFALRNSVAGAHGYSFFSSGGGPAPVGTFGVYDEFRNTVVFSISPTGVIQGANNKNISYTSYTTPPSTIAVGASPFSYQNATGYDADIIVDIGTLTSIAFSRDNVTYYTTGLIAGIVHLSPGDWIKVTYTVAPTMTLIPR